MEPPDAVGFVLTELDVAATCVRLAKSTGSATKRRNRENARMAYDTVLYFLTRARLLEGDRLIS